MSHQKTIVTGADVWDRADRMIVSQLTAIHPLRIYGVPRAGIPVSYAVAAICQKKGLANAVVDAPEDATVFVDDVIDSGRTKKAYQNAYPEVPFLALYDKLSVDAGIGWLVFPWEAKDGCALESAEDIPIRLLQYIGENPARGGLLETPKRMLKAWRHWTSGYKQSPEEVLKVFEDGAENCDEMVIVRGIQVYSHCEHHLAPFFGTADVAYIPNGKIVGLSKLNRLVDLYARRLQVQERLTNQVAHALMDHLEPHGVGVVLRCRHMCMESRGIQQKGCHTVSSAMLGCFRDNGSTREEFMRLTQNDGSRI